MQHPFTGPQFIPKLSVLPVSHRYPSSTPGRGRFQATCNASVCFGIPQDSNMYVVSQGRVPDCCYVRLGMAPSIQTGDFSLRKTEVQSTDMSMAVRRARIRTDATQHWLGSAVAKRPTMSDHHQP
eukprot:6415188-Prymnesium_polylepis.3